MLIFAVILFVLVGGGITAMGVKYLKSEVPVDYHAQILSAAPIGDATRTILGALYKVMGGAFVALGIGTILIALFGVATDLLWAKLTLLVMALISGWFAASVPKAVEAQTGVKTPWRIAAGLMALALLGFVLSVI
ncbi:hypothetical protein [Primorskyibacter sp. 2E233]|uniref:hypothetical protein n=1 Tax=Primorskyibacter sp. 2E233 TaxID=3413431 RepID=UPI003BEFE00F